MKLWEKVKAYRDERGYPWYDKPWDLNLFVIRDDVVGTWGDWVVITCLDDFGRRIVQRIRATGDASEDEWLNPTHPDGCNYVLDQHVPGGLILGEHRGRPALRQQKPFFNVRWPADGTTPRVSQLEARAEEGHAFVDIRGTHLHNNWDGRAPERPRPGESESCTVSLWWHQHAAMIELVKQQLRFRGSAVVSPTYCKRVNIQGLIDESEGT